jgi:chemotaxis protein CheD
MSAWSDGPTRKINIVQGEQHVDNDPNVVLTTILGSCVAACMWDAVAGYGGMNHFLLPGERSSDARAPNSDRSVRYGVHAMELLVNGLLDKGAQRRRLQAKLFGGARMVEGLTDVGEMNAAFAEQFLAAEKIALVSSSLRGQHGRRIQFCPVSGRARQVFIGQDQTGVIAAEDRMRARVPVQAGGDVELF